ncbi:MAG: SseB family protein [Paracoccaceae bacterium]
METPLDRAWAASDAAKETGEETGGDDAMARYYEVFAAVELFLAVDPETLASEAPQPMLFPAEGAETALVFDNEDRLAAFMGEGVAHLALSGRAVMAMFAGSGVRIGVNLGDAPSATILPAEAVDWAAAAFRQPIEAETGAALSLGPPRGASADLLARIDARLAALGDVVAEGWLCAGEDGALILCLALREDAAERAVVAALAETARFVGGEAAAFAIAVLDAGDPRLAAARRHGLGFEPPAPAPARIAPGSDPASPPKLR